MNIFEHGGNRLVFRSRFSYWLGEDDEPTLPKTDCCYFGMPSGLRYTGDHLDVAEGEIFERVNGEIWGSSFFTKCPVWFIAGPLFDAALAHGIEAEGRDPSSGLGAKHESPVATIGSDAP